MNDFIAHISGRPAGAIAQAEFQDFLIGKLAAQWDARAAAPWNPLVAVVCQSHGTS